MWQKELWGPNFYFGSLDQAQLESFIKKCWDEKGYFHLPCFLGKSENLKKIKFQKMRCAFYQKRVDPPLSGKILDLTRLLLWKASLG